MVRGPHIARFTRGRGAEGQISPLSPFTMKRSQKRPTKSKKKKKENNHVAVGGCCMELEEQKSKSQKFARLLLRLSIFKKRLPQSRQRKIFGPGALKFCLTPPLSSPPLCSMRKTGKEWSGVEWSGRAGSDDSLLPPSLPRALSPLPPPPFSTTHSPQTHTHTHTLSTPACTFHTECMCAPASKKGRPDCQPAAPAAAAAATVDTDMILKKKAAPLFERHSRSSSLSCCIQL